jgi:hypothetical protein
MGTRRKRTPCAPCLNIDSLNVQTF